MLEAEKYAGQSTFSATMIIVFLWSEMVDLHEKANVVHYSTEI